LIVFQKSVMEVFIWRLNQLFSTNLSHDPMENLNKECFNRISSMNSTTPQGTQFLSILLVKNVPNHWWSFLSLCKQINFMIVLFMLLPQIFRQYNLQSFSPLFRWFFLAFSRHEHDFKYLQTYHWNIWSLYQHFLVSQ